MHNHLNYQSSPLSPCSAPFLINRSKAASADCRWQGHRGIQTSNCLFVARPPCQPTQASSPADFNQLIIEQLAGFTNCPAEAVERGIRATLTRTCECLQIERACVWSRPDREKPAVRLAYVYRRPEARQIQIDAPVSPLTAQNESATGIVDIRESFPWITAQVEQGRMVAFANAGQLPGEAGRDKEALTRLATRSALVVPFHAEGRVVGAVSFAFTREEHNWPEPLVEQLQLAAQVLGAGMARRLREQQLAAAWSQAHEFKSALDAHATVTVIDAQGTLTYVNDNFCQRSGYGREELLGKDYMVLGTAHHPAAFFDQLWATVSQGGIWRGEIRHTARDGSCYWHATTVVPRLDERGKPCEYVSVGFDITERKLAEEALSRSRQEIRQLKERLQDETAYLKSEIKLHQQHGDIIGRSEGIKRVLRHVEQVAPVDCTVLITGETGTGKELIARAIHRLSRRRDRPMVILNCAALPSTLVESELFGRERGAYTGALTSEGGRFELADGSTIFLDEIGELSLEVQAKLLRVMQEGEFQRLGSSRTRKVNVRVIAATNKDLAKEVREGRFREDLFYRLRVFPINVPPLRERMEDLPLLVMAFVEEFSKRMSKQVKRVPRTLLEQLQQHPWPGNIRELRNAIERGVILAPGDTLVLPALSDSISNATPAGSLEEVDRMHIIKTLTEAGWRVKGPFGAARRLNLNPSTLYSRMAKLGIHRPQLGDGMST